MDDGLGSALPLILIELVLVLGGVLAFGIWQIRSTRRDREHMLAQRARETERKRQDEAAQARTAQTEAPVASGGGSSAATPAPPPEASQADRTG
jgi:uncharacterized protein HemX